MANLPVLSATTDRPVTLTLSARLICCDPPVTAPERLINKASEEAATTTPELSVALARLLTSTNRTEVSAALPCTAAGPDSKPEPAPKLID